MNKAEFLEQLDEKLSVLNEEERKDILDEYAQHIDIKMMRGMSEESAIADFGDLKDLTTDILEAYHVKADYMDERPKKPFFSGVAEGFRRAANRAGQLCAGAAAGVRRFFARGWQAVKRGCGRLAGLCRRPFAGWKARREAGVWSPADSEVCDRTYGYSETGVLEFSGAVGTGADRVGTGADRAGIGDYRAGTGADGDRAGDDRAGIGDDWARIGADLAGTGADRTGIGVDRAGTGDDRAGAGETESRETRMTGAQEQGARTEAAQGAEEETPSKGRFRGKGGKGGMKRVALAAGDGPASMQDSGSGRGLFSAVGAGIAALWNGCIALCMRCFWLAWNCLFVGLGVWLGFGGCLALFCLAALLVLSLMGYPVIGIMIGALGLTMCFGAAGVWCFTVLHCSRKKAEAGAGEPET